MRIIKYRRVPFVDREKEEEFLVSRLQREPEKILFIYGPKSSGKTTLVEYIVENILQEDKNYYVNYVNFRSYAIAGYREFLDIYFQPIREEQKSWLSRLVERLPFEVGVFRGNASLPLKGASFGLNIELYNQLKRYEADPFIVLKEILERIRKRRLPILILDEVQILQGIYMNGEVRERELLSEFFNFLVRLTKETHLAHVVVMTSETLFLEKIYNHSKLAETSDFYKVGHLGPFQVEEWLRQEGIEDKAVIQLIWDYVGGSAHRVNDAIRVVKEGGDVEEYLTDEARTYRGKLSHFIAKALKDAEAKERFRRLLKELIKNGFVLRDSDDDLATEVIEKAIEYEFLFMDPKDERIVFNSQIIKKGAEMVCEDTFKVCNN